MDTTLAINPGSSSKKYALYRGEHELLRMECEREGSVYRSLVSRGRERVSDEAIEEEMYRDALSYCLRSAVQEGVLESEEEIHTVGVRVVAPHPFFLAHRVIDVDYEEMLRTVVPSAPLHIPSTLEEILNARKVLPHATIVGASDSAFHAGLPLVSTRYSVSEQERNTYHARRFGYHGLSVESVVRDLASLIGSLPPRVLVVHVGSGVSVTAVREGKSIETTMGFAPASGLVMGTRGGDIDGALLLHLMRVKGMTLDEGERYLNTATGLVGLTGESDLRVILARAEKRDQVAHEALALYFRRIHMALGAERSVLGGVDAVVLTATAAERNGTVRARIVEGLLCDGVILDERANECLFGRGGCISAKESAIPVYMIPTHEMREVARVARAHAVK